MLKVLHIRDFAVIEELEIQFERGLTVFTGETGAGKSIIVDALGQVLGDRADSTFIRSHCDNTEITAIFEISRIGSIKPLLEEQDIRYQDELMLRRVINRDGRSRAYANGSPVTLQFLQSLAAELVDIHGQHANQSLLKRPVQRQLLDEFGQYPDLLNSVRQHYRDWSDANHELEKLTGNHQDRDAHKSLLQYQVQELDALNPISQEIAQLDEEHSRLNNAGRLLEASRNALLQLSENESSILNQLNHIENEMNGVLRFDNKIKTITGLLETAVIQINEATSELQHYLENIDLDPEHMQQVEQRISAIHEIARKHKLKPEQLEEHLENLKSELQALDNSEQQIRKIIAVRDKALAHYQQAANELSKHRLTAAKKLSAELTEKIRQLGMPGGKVDIQVTDEDEDPKPDGMNRVEFMVAINPGQAFQPLNKVASGGELSRISLAIQVIASRDKGIPTLIFDEVDSGIGGAVAEIVGKLMRDLAGKRQIFCVTHLAQVAAQGNHHVQVNKSTHADTTLTQVIHLTADARVEEIARMLGGMKITGQSRAHAREMLKL